MQTSKIKNILVIENDETRIDWLSSILPFNTNVHHFTVVNDFITEYPKMPWDMIIFDCDLDPGNKFELDSETGLFLTDPDKFLESMNKDINGHNGVDAAKMLCEQHKSCLEPDVPVVIWSGNPSGAEEIKRILKTNGFSNISKFPYSFYFLKSLEDAIIKNLVF